MCKGVHTRTQLLAISPQCNFMHLFLSADSISSALLVGLREEGRRKEEGGGLFSNSLVELEELKVWEC